MKLGTCLMRVRRVSLEGKDALFYARQSASSTKIGYMPYEG